ncbi:CLUMA_CG002141, isoform A [Clunio marinus]|uniref:CLUMA_CG002141, isoform A n=1 Tax=Clunio marinus TaxID=568069 RepID=A0A1J1HLS8_9DIPT|nr:CLUMA_CG002141, isoform A [Clunio marinus]
MKQKSQILFAINHLLLQFKVNADLHFPGNTPKYIFNFNQQHILTPLQNPQEKSFALLTLGFPIVWFRRNSWEINEEVKLSESVLITLLELCRSVLTFYLASRHSDKKNLMRSNPTLSYVEKDSKPRTSRFNKRSAPQSEVNGILFIPLTQFTTLNVVNGIRKHLGNKLVRFVGSIRNQTKSFTNNKLCLKTYANSLFNKRVR